MDKKKQKTEQKPTFDLTKNEDQSVSIKIAVPWQIVEKTRTEVEEELSKGVSVPGFRKGSAPKHIATAKIGKERVNEELLKKLLPTYYIEAIKDLKLNPIINPQVHVDAFDEGTSLIFTCTTCEEPTIDLKDYKEEVKKVTAPSKLVLPGKETEEKKPDVEKILDAILSRTTITLPKILIDQEVNRLLSQLIDEVKSLGLTLDGYLASRGKTAEQLRAEYSQKAERDLKIEFVLRKIADSENITVDQKDIDGILGTVTDQNQKQELAKNPYFLASLIRQQKTVDFLAKI